jgi:hypothetical protein
MLLAVLTNNEMSFFVCAAVMLIRNLDVFFGTVGGLIAGTKILFL